MVKHVAGVDLKYVCPGSIDGPSSNLHVLTLSFSATGAANPVIRPGINNLLDNTGSQIGTLQGDSVQIEIPGSVSPCPTVLCGITSS
jgi:hypothetical protein